MSKIYTLNPGSKVVKESERLPGVYVGMLTLSRTAFYIEESTEGYKFNNSLTISMPPWWPEFARKAVRKMLMDSRGAIQAQVMDFMMVHELPLKPEPGWKPPPPPPPPKLASIYHLPGPVINDGLPGLFGAIEEAEKNV